MDKKPIHVVMVDDHQLFCRAMMSLLSGYQDRINLISVCNNGEQMKTCLRQQVVDVLLLDIVMPNESGIQLLHFLRKNYPDLPVLMLSSITSAEIVQEAIQIGAKGFLSKSTDEEDIIEAVETVFRGAPYYGKDIARILYDVSLSKSLKPEILTPREQEIVSLCSEGITCCQIADKLHISVRRRPFFGSWAFATLLNWCVMLFPTVLLRHKKTWKIREITY